VSRRRNTARHNRVQFAPARGRWRAVARQRPHPLDPTVGA
jgi:hypothetical protein